MIGDVLEAQGHRHRALKMHRDALEALERLEREDPGAGSGPGGVFACYRRLSEIAEPLNPAEARRWCKTGMDRLAELEQAQLPVDTDEKTQLIALAARLGLCDPPPAASDAQS